MKTLAADPLGVPEEPMHGTVDPRWTITGTVASIYLQQDRTGYRDRLISSRNIALCLS